MNLVTECILRRILELSINRFEQKVLLTFVVYGVAYVEILMGIRKYA